MAERTRGTIRAWFGQPPRVEAPVVAGYTQLTHERADMVQLSVVGVVLLPLWWFIFAGLAQIISGVNGFTVHIGLVELLGGVLVALLGVPLLHEIAHGLTARLLGARPSYGVGPGYAYTTFLEPMGRYRYLAVGLAPLVGISLLGMLLIWFAPDTRGWVVFACVVNAAGAIGDMWMVYRILRLPRRAIFFDLADGFAAFVPDTNPSRPPAGSSAPPAG
ncbi:MAG: hypothetical protein DCC58_14185 [Chloroflexi bacterium]|nr:MAG: hypothetical protein DCC58_14185 [Chloroflexota bacterium]